MHRAKDIPLTSRHLFQFAFSVTSFKMINESFNQSWTSLKNLGLTEHSQIEFWHPSQPFGHSTLQGQP